MHFPRVSLAGERLYAHIAGRTSFVHLFRGARALAGRALRHMRRLAVRRLARVHRRALTRPVFIGVTGSGGKTAAKDLIAAVLACRFEGRKSPDSKNDLDTIARTILGVRPWHRYCVQEIAITTSARYGSLGSNVRLFRPRIGVVTHVGGDHRSTFGSLDAIAAEKSKLIAALPPDGTAVLNADDPRVLAMRSRFPGRVVTYGLAPDATVRGEDVRADWPDRLAFTVRYAGQVLPVQTRLCGAHWVSAVLAALAVGVVMDVPLADAVRAVGTVEPFRGRMSPATDPRGVTFVRDDWKASLWTIPAALEFLRRARAIRKIVVLGTISDHGGKSSRTYVTVARQALEAADYVFFVGPWASRCLRAKRHADDQALRAFGTAKEASDYLDGFLRPGDLVLVKGSHFPDRLARLSLARTIGVACWRSRCELRIACDVCALLQVPSGPFPEPVTRDSAMGPRITPPDAARPLHVLVGLGNRGTRYDDTPHNIGQRVLDRLARMLDASWTEEEGALLARAEWRGEAVWLVKPLTSLNATGAALLRLADRLGFDATACTLVHDDLDLPLGTVRTRVSGSAGGHNGVRSVLVAFQSEDFPRVKIGIGGPTRLPGVAGHLLKPFSPAERPAVEAACALAAERALAIPVTLRTAKAAKAGLRQAADSR